MKKKNKLTINTLAMGNLKQRRKQYTILIIGIIFAAHTAVGTGDGVLYTAILTCSGMFTVALSKRLARIKYMLCLIYFSVTEGA